MDSGTQGNQVPARSLLDWAEAEWIKSPDSYSNGNCVEIADLGGQVGVRNSRDPAGPVLVFTPDEWHAFVGGVRNGEFGRIGNR